MIQAQAEIRGDHPQEALGLELRAADGRGDGVVLRQVVQEVVDEDRLAGTDLAGDDDEAFRLAQAEAEIGQRPALRQAPIVEAEIRRQVEGIFPQLEEVGVFHLLRSEEHTSELQSLMRISY